MNSASDELRRKVAGLEKFAAVIAHEFKGSLALMQGFTARLESAARSGEWDQFQRDVIRIEQIGHQLSDTVDALRELDRRDTACAESVSLSQSATEALELLRTLLNDSIAVTISSALPTVVGHPALWRTVYRNLIHNALKACAGREGAHIEVGCEQQDGKSICFVRDNGCGVAAAKLKQLLDAEQPPTSLGLWLVQRILQQHGGKIFVESNEVGTTVKWEVRNAES